MINELKDLGAYIIAPEVETVKRHKIQSEEIPLQFPLRYPANRKASVEQ